MERSGWIALDPGLKTTVIEACFLFPFLFCLSILARFSFFLLFIYFGGATSGFIYVLNKRGPMPNPKKVLATSWEILVVKSGYV